MRKPFPPLLLLMPIAALASYGVFVKASPSMLPRVIANASRDTYTVGEPISINYRVVNDGAISMTFPLPSRSTGECDSRLYVSVRTADGAELPPTLSYSAIGKKWLTQSDRTNRTTPPDTVNVNDMVTIARPGLYRVTVYVEINPEGGGDYHESDTSITIRVVDTPQARAKRRARVAFAAKILRDANTSTQARSEAIRALAYNCEPEALPVLLDAYVSSNSTVRDAAYGSLTLWHNSRAAYDAAHTRMKSLARDKKPVLESDWEGLLGSWECLGAGEDFDRQSDGE